MLFPVEYMNKSTSKKHLRSSEKPRIAQPTGPEITPVITEPSAPPDAAPAAVPSY